MKKTVSSMEKAWNDYKKEKRDKWVEHLAGDVGLDYPQDPPPFRSDSEHEMWEKVNEYWEKFTPEQFKIWVMKNVPAKHHEYIFNRFGIRKAWEEYKKSKR